MEYQRRQLAVTIEQTRQKRPISVPNIGLQHEGGNIKRPAIEDQPQTKPFGVKATVRHTLPAKTRDYSNVPTHEDLAQRVADWPHRQPPPNGPAMQFDAEVIENFLQHAARFVKRYDKLATPEDVEEMMTMKVRNMEGRENNPPSEVELAVRTLQHWQFSQEQTTMLHNVRSDQYPNPNNFMIHLSESNDPMTPHFLRRNVQRPPFEKREEATIVEIHERVDEKPSEPWIVRLSYPATKTIAVCYDTGDANEVGEKPISVDNGISVRRDGNMVEFVGPPKFETSITLSYADVNVRLRLCTDYVILEERFRLDRNGISNILLNTVQLESEPATELCFFDAKFEPMRIRYKSSRAQLDNKDGKYTWKGLGVIVDSPK